jgi:hypothetical protein
MQTKDLLSQNEIDSLLDIFSSPDEDKNTDILFEVGMAKVAKGIENYLDILGLQFDNVRVIKSTTEHKNSYNYNPEYLYLENLSIDNSLALSILAARFGAKEKNFSLDRELTSLEKQLLEDLSREIAYIVEKELDSYLAKDNGLEKIADYSLLVSQENAQSAMQLSFTTAPVVLQEQEPVETSDVDGIKVEAVVGMITVDVLEQGAMYKLHAFGKNRAVLLLDETLPFMAKRLQESDSTLLFALQEAVTDKTMLAGYYLSVAAATIDDEALLALAHGTVLDLKPYDDVQIHKDGKMVAKAKAFFSNGEIAVKVLEGYK